MIAHFFRKNENEIRKDAPQSPAVGHTEDTSWRTRKRVVSISSIVGQKRKGLQKGAQGPKTRANKNLKSISLYTYLTLSLSLYAKPRQICAGAQTALATDLRLWSTHSPHDLVQRRHGARSVAVRAAPWVINFRREGRGPRPRRSRASTQYGATGWAGPWPRRAARPPHGQCR